MVALSSNGPFSLNILQRQFHIRRVKLCIVKPYSQWLHTIAIVFLSIRIHCMQLPREKAPLPSLSFRTLQLFCATPPSSSGYGTFLACPKDAFVIVTPFQADNLIIPTVILVSIENIQHDLFYLNNSALEAEALGPIAEVSVSVSPVTLLIINYQQPNPFLYGQSVTCPLGGIVLLIYNGLKWISLSNLAVNNQCNSSYSLICIFLVNNKSCISFGFS